MQLDLRRKIVEDIVEDGGDFVTGFFPGTFSEIAERNRVKFDTVRKIWKEVEEKGDTGITKTHAAGVKQIQRDDIDFIRFLKTDRALMTAGELYKHTKEHCNIAAGTSNTAIRRVLRNNMTDGKWTWKTLTRPVVEKFTPDNLLCTHKNFYPFSNWTRNFKEVCFHDFSDVFFYQYNRNGAKQRHFRQGARRHFNGGKVTGPQEFMEFVDESGRGGDTKIRSYSTHRWFSQYLMITFLIHMTCF